MKPASDSQSREIRQRTLAVVRDIMAVLRECALPDSEFLLMLGDGCDGQFWPTRTWEGDLYAPVFVQEMTSTAGELLRYPTKREHASDRAGRKGPGDGGEGGRISAVLYISLEFAVNIPWPALLSEQSHILVGSLRFTNG